MAERRENPGLFECAAIGAKNKEGFDALLWGRVVGHGHVSEVVLGAVRAAETSAGTLDP